MVRRVQLNTMGGGWGTLRERAGGVGGGRGNQRMEDRGRKLRERERENCNKRSAEHNEKESYRNAKRESERELTIPLFTLLVYSFWQYTEN